MIFSSDGAHGGPDAQGVALHDFSTNGNACGPCPDTLRAVQRADAEHYPDPAYARLKERLSAFHGVAARRIVMAASASEFIFRITAAVAARGGAKARVWLPAMSYGDYGRAAQAWRLAIDHAEPAATGASRDTAADARAGVSLVWHCEPSSPLGQSDACLGANLGVGPTQAVRMVDLAYAPLRLTGAMGVDVEQLDRTWQLWTPNKALGLTGLRAAYAIAPVDAGEWLDAVESLAPSWPVGAHGVALLDSWTTPAAQEWLEESLATLCAWKARQIALCESLGWHCLPSDTNFFCAELPVDDVAACCGALRRHGIKLRDTASFGLPGHVRVAVLGPASQAALHAAWCATATSATA